MSGTSKASATKETREAITRKRFADRAAKTSVDDVRPSNTGSRHVGDGSGPVVYLDGDRGGVELAQQSGNARVQRARRQSHNQVQADGSKRSEARPKTVPRLGTTGDFADVGGDKTERGKEKPLHREIASADLD